MVLLLEAFLLVQIMLKACVEGYTSQKIQQKGFI